MLLNSFCLMLLQIEEDKKAKAEEKYKKWLEETNRKLKTNSKQKNQIEKVRNLFLFN